jgi:hypothetical protein
MFPHRNTHKYTWTSPDGKNQNQVGHVLIDRRRHSNIHDVRYFRGADCDTDHYLVVANVGQTVGKHTSSTEVGVEKFNLKKLSELEVRKQYQTKISNRLRLWRNSTIARK